MKKHPTFFMRLVSPVYQGAWRLARPFLGKHKRLADGWDERLVPDGWVDGFEGKTVWIQAASGGEAYLLVNIAKELVARLQGQDAAKLRILATTCTRQGMDVLEKGLPAAHGLRENAGMDAADANVRFILRYFPLDEPRLMQQAIEQAAPAQIVLLETELWPGLLMAAWQNDIPVQILNGRITPKSMSGYGMLPAPFWKKLAPRKILAVSAPDAERYSALFGGEAVGQMPNIKFDLLAARQAGQLPGAPGSSDASGEPDGGSGKIALFASVRKQEADQVAKAIQALKKQAPDSQIVLAPRHLHHVSVWQRHISLVGLKSELRSEVGDEQISPQELFAGLAEDAKSAVLIWDKFGELKKLYSLASAAYVGGSLVPLGGQNFLEALASGIEPCIGPFYSNFAWAGEEILEMTRQVDTPDQLAANIAGQLEKPACRKEVQEQFAKSVARQQGGTGMAVDAIIELLG